MPSSENSRLRRDATRRRRRRYASKTGRYRIALDPRVDAHCSLSPAVRGEGERAGPVRENQDTIRINRYCVERLIASRSYTSIE